MYRYIYISMPLDLASIAPPSYILAVCLLSPTVTVEMEKI